MNTFYLLWESIWYQKLGWIPFNFIANFDEAAAFHKVEYTPRLSCYILPKFAQESERFHNIA